MNPCLKIAQFIPPALSTIDITPTIQVPIRNRDQSISYALISKAKQVDMPLDWQCDWNRLFLDLEEDYYEGIVKIKYQNVLLGLVKYTFYPNPPDHIEFLEINHLEALPKPSRKAHPIGRWLIWYVCNLALNYCSLESSAKILFLNSVGNAFTFYRDTIRMEYIEPVTLAPGEDGYAFRFNRRDAQNFCENLEKTYGCPAVL